MRILLNGNSLNPAWLRYACARWGVITGSLSPSTSRWSCVLQHLVACQLLLGTALQCFAGTIGWVGQALVMFLIVDVRGVGGGQEVGATCRPCGETGRALHVACLVLEESLHEGRFVTGSVEMSLR